MGYKPYRTPFDDLGPPIVQNLGLRRLDTAGHSPLGNTPQTWTDLVNHFADVCIPPLCTTIQLMLKSHRQQFPENFRSSEEARLNLLLLKGIFDLSETQEVDPAGWKRDMLDQALCSGLSW
jgi:hypothetical protein